MKAIKRNWKKIIAATMAVAMVLSLAAYYRPQREVKASDSFPTSGVHTGTLTHGAYHQLTGLYNSTGAKVCEADTMNSEGGSRAGFCLSPGVGETKKTGAYKSSTYQSGYGLKYFKALIAFYYDAKGSYNGDTVRYATQFFVWRTVKLEKNHKGNFSPSVYDGSGFKAGFVASIKSITGCSDETAGKLYEE